MENKAYEFDHIANDIFFPIYPVIAQQIIQKTKINEGNCLDIGSGGGHLGLFIAKLTNMKVVLYDKSKYALEIAEKRIMEWGLENRASTLLGDVHQIPAVDEGFQLVVSRGSLWFWENPDKALKEIYRILASGGYAYIGGGFGNVTLKKMIDKKMRKTDKDWPHSRERFTEGNTPEKFTKILVDIGINNFEIIESKEEQSIWIIFKKS